MVLNGGSLMSDVEGSLGNLKNAVPTFASNVINPTSPYAPIYYVTAAVLALYALNFLLPGSTVKNLNWNHLKNSLNSAADSALTLLPALSALIIPDSNPVTYAGVGFALYFVGLGVQCIPNPTCRTNLGGAGCSKVEKAWYFAGKGLQTAGTSSLVGSVLIYMQNQIVSKE